MSSSSNKKNIQQQKSFTRSKSQSPSRFLSKKYEIRQTRRSTRSRSPHNYTYSESDKHKQIIVEFPMSDFSKKSQQRSPSPISMHHNHRHHHPHAVEPRLMLPPHVSHRELSPRHFIKDRSLSRERISSKDLRHNISKSPISSSKSRSIVTKNKTPSTSPPRVSQTHYKPKPNTPPHSSKYEKRRSASPKRLSSPSSNMSHLETGGVSHYFDNDEKDSTRTLFVGNLDNDIEQEFLKRLFSRFGIVEEIDIKRNISVQPPPFTLKSSSSFNSQQSSKTYAFVRFQDMDMATEAKNKMNGKRLNGRNECKIGYGNFKIITTLIACFLIKNAIYLKSFILFIVL